MKRIELLDCSLRDGGYINNWEFGYKNIQQIILNLSSANLDFVECGFLKSKSIFDKSKNDEINKSIYNSIEEFVELISGIDNINCSSTNIKYSSNAKYCLMINYNDIGINEIPSLSSCAKLKSFSNNIENNIFLRLAFKKKDSSSAIEFAKELINREYNIFFSPMNVCSYSYSELIELIKKVNIIKPRVFSIVDTIGALKTQEVISIAQLINNYLDDSISLCFHSHNNLNLSYLNAVGLVNESRESKRNLIIDCTLSSIGRGAGNLACEKMALYCNKLFKQDIYNLDLINKTINDYINPIYNKTPWGLNEIYCLSASCRLHPNYAKYLIDRNISSKKAKEIFKLIPDNKKEEFDIRTIEKITL